MLEQQYIKKSWPVVPVGFEIITDKSAPYQKCGIRQYGILSAHRLLGPLRNH